MLVYKSITFHSAVPGLNDAYPLLTAIKKRKKRKKKSTKLKIDLAMSQIRTQIS